MLQILRYLPVHCAKGAEFASFAVYFWSSLDGLLVCGYGAESANFVQFAVVVGELRETWLIHSNFLVSLSMVTDL